MRTRPARTTGTLVIVALGLANAFTLACPVSPGAPDAQPACDASPRVAWGRRVNGAFVAFADGDSAEVIRGFQGFRFIDGVAQVSGASAAQGIFTFQVTVDGHDPSTQSVGRLDLVAGPNGTLEANALQLFFNDIPMPELIGRSADVVLVANVAGCSAQAHAKVKLTTGSCQLPDGGIVPCADAGF